MIYSVMILICFVSMAPEDCDVSNAADVMQAPEHEEGLAECQTYGLEYAAMSNLVVPGKTWPKVVCTPVGG